MDAATAKGVAAAVIFLAGLLGAAFAFILRSRKGGALGGVCGERTRRKMRVGITLFSGGVLTAAGFVHMLFEASGAMAELHGSHSDEESSVGGGEEEGGFPWAFFLAGLGFFVTLAVDAASDKLSERVAAPPDGSPGYGTSTPASLSSVSRAAAHSHGHSDAGPAHVAVAVTESPAESRGPEAGALASSSRRTCCTPARQSATAVMLLLCLSFHSIIAGLAMGAEDSPETIMDLFIAIIAHKTLAAMALASALLASGVMRRIFVTAMVGFALVTPTGIGLGALIAGFTEDSPAIAAVSAFAAGTFIYVGATEMVTREMARAHDVSLSMRIAAIVAGYGAMSLLALWV